MHADLRRLVGQPVLEYWGERREALLQRHDELRERVYIPIEGVAEGDVLASRGAEDEGDEDSGANELSHGSDGKFQVTADNPSFDLLRAVDTKFLSEPTKQLLLLSGPAGSGKSTFVNELELYLESTYRDARIKEGADVVLIRISLPTINPPVGNPLSNLFEDACKQIGLRDMQIAELRELVHVGAVELVFLLDAYDELKPELVMKNLYAANNLEEFRKRTEVAIATNAAAAPATEAAAMQEAAAATTALLAQPKVIITARTELLSQNPGYETSFLPYERENVRKDEE
eukprot:4306100-Prymnesium_polylepis.1